MCKRFRKINWETLALIGIIAATEFPIKILSWHHEDADVWNKQILQIKVIDNTATFNPSCHFRSSYLKIIQLVPATRRTTLSAVSSCNTERGCCFCQSSRETRSYSMLLIPTPHSLVWRSPSVTITRWHHDLLYLSQFWPRSHDLQSPVLCLVCSCTLSSPHQDTPCLQTSALGPDTRHSQSRTFPGFPHPQWSQQPAELTLQTVGSRQH